MCVFFFRSGVASQALIHLSLARELSTAESQQPETQLISLSESGDLDEFSLHLNCRLSNFLDKVTDKQENVLAPAKPNALHGQDVK